MTTLKLYFDTISVEGLKRKFLLIPQLRFTIKECKIIYLTISDAISPTIMPVHYLSMQRQLLLPIVNRQMVILQCLSYKSMFPSFTRQALYHCITERLQSKIVSEYDQEISQSQTAHNPMARLGRAAQPSRDTRKTN